MSLHLCLLVVQPCPSSLPAAAALLPLQILPSTRSKPYMRSIECGEKRLSVPSSNTPGTCRLFFLSLLSLWMCVLCGSCCSPFLPSVCDVRDLSPIHSWPCCRDLSPSKRLTIGYVSADLFMHSVSYFAEAPLRNHSFRVVWYVVFSLCTRSTP